MASNFAGFITTNYIKKNTPVLEYVNEDILQSFIRPAQDVHIERTLGTSFYKDLMNKINNSTLNSDEESLLREYIQPALQYWTIYEYILHANYKFTNKAISKQNSDNSTPSELNEVQYLKTNIRDWGEYYTQRLSDHLKDNSSLYPKYNTYIVSNENKAPKTDNYLFGGLYIPKSRWYDCPGPSPWNSLNLYW